MSDLEITALCMKGAISKHISEHERVRGAPLRMGYRRVVPALQGQRERSMYVFADVEQLGCKVWRSQDANQCDIRAERCSTCVASRSVYITRECGLDIVMCMLQAVVERFRV